MRARLQSLRFPTSQKPPLETPVYMNFSMPPCDMSQRPNRNCSEILVQMILKILGGFWEGGSGFAFSDKSKFRALPPCSPNISPQTRASPRISAMGISSARFNRRDDRRSLAIAITRRPRILCSCKWHDFVRSSRNRSGNPQL